MQQKEVKHGTYSHACVLTESTTWHRIFDFIYLFLKCCFYNTDFTGNMYAYLSVSAFRVRTLLNMYGGVHGMVCSQNVYLNPVVLLQVTVLLLSLVYVVSDLLYFPYI